MAEIKYNATSMTQAVIKKTIEEFAPQSISNKGGYTYINGSLIPNALSRILARAYRTGRIFRPGIGMTEEFIGATDPASFNNVTVQLQTNMGVHVRTLRNNNSAGTPNNDGIINTNKKLIPSTKPFDIPVRQLNDQPLFFPRMMLQTMLFDEVVETLGNFNDNEINANDAYHLAKMVAYACYRGAQKTNGSEASPSNYGDNIIVFDMSNGYQDKAAIKLINNINAVMSNGDKDTNLGTFRGRRQFTAMNSLLGIIRTPGTGFIIPGTEKGENLFYSENFDLGNAMQVGEQYRFSTNGYDFYEMNSGTLSLAEQWLGLDAGALNGVLGVISTPLSYASGGVSKKATYLLQSTEYDGVVGFPYTKFGGTAYRKIFLIVDSTWTVPTKLQSKFAPAPVCAPGSWADNDYEPIERVVYDNDGNPISMETIANVVAPNGDTNCAVTITVFGSDKAKINNATLAPTVGGQAVAYTNNADGTYTIVVPKGSVIAGSITVASYKAGTINVTASQTKGWNFATSVTLTPSG